MHVFDRFTTGCARFIGRPTMLVLCLILAAFAIAAVLLGNERMQWAASLSISVITVLLLPVLQATQNRDAAALHAKLDELIKTDAKARDVLIGLENRTEEEIKAMRAEEQNAAR